MCMIIFVYIDIIFLVLYCYTMQDTGVRHFSKHLFWDVDINKLEIIKDKLLIIERVFTYGKENDERLLFKLYDAAEIKKIVKKSRNLNLNTVLYLSAILNIPRKKFKCISNKQFQQIY